MPRGSARVEDAEVYKSISTIKADLAHSKYDAEGQGIVWAVIDSGIDNTHPHFKLHKNLELPSGLQHRDFNPDVPIGTPLKDELGHGTHVAGILAGAMNPAMPLKMATR